MCVLFSLKYFNSAVMENLSICRICLIKDVRMHCLVNTDLQEIYELLTGNLLETRDKRPVDACYVCCARLRNCLQLRSACLHSEELFTHSLDNDDFDVKPLLSTLHTIPATCIDVDSVLNRELTPTTGDQLDEEHVGDLEDNIAEQGMCTQLIQQHIKCEDVTLEEDDSIPNVEEDTKSESDDYCLQNDPLEIDIPKSDHSISSVNLQTNSSKTIKVDLLNLNTVGKVANTKKPKPADPEDTSLSTVGNNPENEQISKPNICEEYKNIAHVPSVIHCKPDSDSVKHNKCDICGKYLSSKSNLLIHVRRHRGEKRYKCDICGRGFDFKSYLLDHIRTHTGETPYKCNICGKGFIQNNKLAIHIRTHTGEKPYKCSTCGKSFIRKDAMSEHVRTHLREKLFSCDACGKRFNSKRYLVVHRRIHTGENPFSCDSCGKSFKSRHCLVSHVATHTSVKLFKCITCGRAFNRKDTLMNHTRTHTAETPYKCYICDKSFSSGSSLNRHSSRVHAGEEPAEFEVEVSLIP